MSAARYRKKPVVIEATQWDGSVTGATTILEWIFDSKPSGAGRYVDSESNAHLSGEPTGDLIKLDTLEGTMSAQPGDFIIRGIKGEFYPCKPDIFEATYEPVETELAG
jgi:hypothetical protein